MSLPIIPADKLQHAAYGALIFIAVAGAAKLIGFPFVGAAGLAGAAAAGAAKEWFDWVSNHRAIKAGLTPTHGVEMWDWVATTAGGLVCFAAGWLV